LVVGVRFAGVGALCPPHAITITPKTIRMPAPPTQLATILNVESAAAAFTGTFSVDGHSTGGFAAPAAAGATDTGPTICILPNSASIFAGAALAVSRTQKSASAISAM